MINNLVISVLASAVVAVIYAFVFAQREEQIREYFRAKARGWLRELYIHATVQAVRGDAAVADSRVLVTLTLLVFMAASAKVLYDAGRLNSEWRHSDEDIIAINNDLSQDSTVPEPGTLRRDLRKRLNTLIAEREGLRPIVRQVVCFEKILGYGLAALFYAGWLFWRPYVLMRTRFAHEIARFSLRIQGLASKDELARLTAAELAVSNAETIRRYVQIMKEVATRHGVPELTKTFELWQN